MNILPLILALVLILSILTVEKLEKFKNQATVQKEYQEFLRMNEGYVFSRRQEKLYKKNEKDLKELSFRFFTDKTARERDPNVTKQYRLLNLELMKILYGETAFYKRLQEKRPHFLDELLNAIEQAADAAPEKFISRINDIARLELKDPELQHAFYRMLKGTIPRRELLKLKEITPQMREKIYLSLFTFINNHGTDNTPTIEIQKSPREILKAIFDNDEVVNAIILKRQELANQVKKKEIEPEAAKTIFENEFFNQKRTGIDQNVLNFEITGSKKNEYD